MGVLVQVLMMLVVAGVYKHVFTLKAIDKCASTSVLWNTGYSNIYDIGVRSPSFSVIEQNLTRFQVPSIVPLVLDKSISGIMLDRANVLTFVMYMPLLE